MSAAHALLLAVTLLAAYWLPGVAILRLFRWESLGRAARWLLPFPLALLGTPLVLNSVAILRPYRPTLVALAILTAVIFAAGEILRRLGRRPAIEFRSRSGGARISRWETWVSAILLVGVAVLAVLPRIHLLIRGSDVSTTVISDIYWHISEVTAIARSGLPPRHYLFPDLPLVYYYWSWIYPATLASAPLAGESLARLLTAHAFINLLAFLGLAYAFLRANLSTLRGRAFGLIALTLIGGFDYFASPGTGLHEWWQSTAPFLVSQVQIPSFLTTYMWVPQHVAGASAFLVALLLWRNVRMPLIGRMLLLALTSAFMFGTSAFVFFSFAVAVLVWAGLNRRAWWRRKAVLAVALAAVVFLALAGPQIRLALAGGSALRWGAFRVVVAEGVLGLASARAAVLDQVLTLLALPLVAAWLLLIEVGLPFVLYLGFAARAMRRGVSRWERFLAIYPLAYLPFALLLLVPNFSMRGMIPVQLVMVLAASRAVDRWNWTRLRPWGKVAAGYALGIVLAAQMLSPWLDWALLARRGLAEALRPAQGFLSLPAGAGSDSGKRTYLIPKAGTLSDSLAYVRWAETSTSPDSLFVEENLAAEPNQYHLLERMRFVAPADLESAASAARDFTLVGNADLVGWYGHLVGDSLAARALSSEFVRVYHPPVYYVSRTGQKTGMGAAVYRDAHVVVYRLQEGK